MKREEKKLTKNGVPYMKNGKSIPSYLLEPILEAHNTNIHNPNFFVSKLKSAGRFVELEMMIMPRKFQPLTP